MDKNILNSVVRLSISGVTINPFAPYYYDDSYPSVGTGFFVGPDLILTCAHVIEDAIKIVFTIPGENKTKYKAEVISVCFDRDVAMLRSVDYTSQTQLTYGDSNTVNISDTVAGVGYPLGFNNIKSAEGTISGRQHNLIQHHVPINKGNSGGPLLNKDNLVIGINSAKIVSDDVEGISYTIPINDVLAMMPELMSPTYEDKVIYEPKFLIKTQLTDNNIRMFFGYKGDNGVLISKILTESPLYNVGVRESDIFVELDGYEIDGSGQVKVPWSVDKLDIDDLLPTFKINQTIPVKFYSVRDKKTINASIQFDPKMRLTVRELYYPYQSIDYEAIGGMIFMDLNYSHIAYLDQSKNIEFFNKLHIINQGKLENINTEKVLLTTVVNGSNVENAYELNPGIFVENINGIRVNNLNDIRNYFNKGFVKKGIKYVYMKFSNGKQIIFNTKDLLQEDIELSKIYKYKVSSLLTHQQ